MSSAVVLDIEGTVSPLSAVHDVLFPYARDRIESWVRQDRPGTREVIADVRSMLGGESGVDDVVRALLGWHDENAKHSPLKTLHGLIWEQGFLAGELAGVFYPDVPLALAEWHRLGMRCWIYSSGSVLAQRLWFSRSDQGDLLGYLAGHFDTRNGGPKQDPASYRRIADAIGTAAGDILFLSDSRAELDAAATAGWRAVGVRRPGCETEFGVHPVVTDFTELGVRTEVA
ncbi:acireductone synthase [Micromonospora sp. NPDC051196]|uniref:acireductone synthase n=1 Tax=Micromonospora sp. NPDC051196 TaxID=3155281 RepID=UPI00341C64B0